MYSGPKTEGPLVYGNWPCTGLQFTLILLNNLRPDLDQRATCDIYPCSGPDINPDPV